MVVTTHCHAWIIVADHYQARLLGLSETPTGKYHLTKYGAIESPIPQVEYDRPYAMAGMSGHNYAANHHRLEEEYRRFAKQLGRWINACIDRFGIEQLSVFMPDRSHTEVMSHIRHAYRDIVSLRGENLLRLSQDELSRHHLITGLLHPYEQLRQTV